MVWVYTGSFRGVRDQPVTDHEGSIPAGVRHIRRVFGAVFGAAARARSRSPCPGRACSSRLGHVDLRRCGASRTYRHRPAGARGLDENGRGTVGRPGGVAEAGPCARPQGRGSSSAMAEAERPHEAAKLYRLGDAHRLRLTPRHRAPDRHRPPPARWPTPRVPDRPPRLATRPIRPWTTPTTPRSRPRATVAPTPSTAGSAPSPPPDIPSPRPGAWCLVHGFATPLAQPRLRAYLEGSPTSFVLYVVGRQSGPTSSVG